MSSRKLESPDAERSRSEVLIIGNARARAAVFYLNAGDSEHALSLARKSAVQQHSAANEDLLGRALIASGQLTEGTLHLQNAARLAHSRRPAAREDVLLVDTHTGLP